MLAMSQIVGDLSDDTTNGTCEVNSLQPLSGESLLHLTYAARLRSEYDRQLYVTVCKPVDPTTTQPTPLLIQAETSVLSLSSLSCSESVFYMLPMLLEIGQTKYWFVRYFEHGYSRGFFEQHVLGLLQSALPEQGEMIPVKVYTDWDVEAEVSHRSKSSEKRKRPEITFQNILTNNKSSLKTTLELAYESLKTDDAISSPGYVFYTQQTTTKRSTDNGRFIMVQGCMDNVQWEDMLLEHVRQRPKPPSDLSVVYNSCYNDTLTLYEQNKILSGLPNYPRWMAKPKSGVKREDHFAMGQGKSPRAKFICSLAAGYLNNCRIVLQEVQKNTYKLDLPTSQRKRPYQCVDNRPTLSKEELSLRQEKERRMALSEGFVKVCQYANNFFTGTLHRKCCPFIIAGKKVGVVPPNVVAAAKKYPDMFEVKLDKATEQVNSVHISSSLTTNEDRSAKMAEVLEEWRRQDLFVSLKGWRDELYSVWHDFSEPPLMKMERTATSLFGVKQYGIHINGYVLTEDKGLCMWIGKRSPTKQTWPNMYDQIAAGGLSTGLGIMECARKEAQEEASIPDDLLDKLRHTGTVSYFYEDERGIFPECQFVLDLELPADFTPVNADGEVASFQLLPMDQIKQMIADGKFKFNCGLVCLDFFIRHGYLTPDNEPKYTYLVENMHKTLP